MAQSKSASQGDQTLRQPEQIRFRQPGSPRGANPRRPKAAPRPIRREVGGTVCLLVGLLSCIGYFTVDAWFIRFFCGFIKGLVGWGFYIFPPALILAGITLLFHRGRPVALRVTFALLLPLLLGAFAHLIFADAVYQELGDGLVRGLYETGMELQSGGFLAGLLAVLLRSAVSIYGGAAPPGAAVCALCPSGGEPHPRGRYGITFTTVRPARPTNPWTRNPSRSRSTGAGSAPASPRWSPSRRTTWSWSPPLCPNPPDGAGPSTSRWTTRRRTRPTSGPVSSTPRPGFARRTVSGHPGCGPQRTGGSRGTWRPPRRPASPCGPIPKGTAPKPAARSHRYPAGRQGGGGGGASLAGGGRQHCRRSRRKR